MNHMQIRGHAGEVIHSFEEWAEHALPPDRRRKHWKEGRSACELARVWTNGGMPEAPDELTTLLDSHDLTRATVITHGITEHETQLPFGSRGPRCHDLFLLGEKGRLTVTVCVEGKADETFGGSVRDELREARKRPRTRFPERLEWLVEALFGRPAFNGDGALLPVIEELPYQLLSGVAGTLLEARNQGSPIAVFVVHEFRTPLTDDRKMERNGAALDAFLKLLFSSNSLPLSGLPLTEGQLLGPLVLSSRRPFDGLAPLLMIGKIRTDRL